jgi:hypothetical protein
VVAGEVGQCTSHMNRAVPSLQNDALLNGSVFECHGALRLLFLHNSSGCLLMGLREGANFLCVRRYNGDCHVYACIAMHISARAHGRLCLYIPLPLTMVQPHSTVLVQQQGCVDFVIQLPEVAQSPNTSLAGKGVGLGTRT